MMVAAIVGILTVVYVVIVHCYRGKIKAEMKETKISQSKGESSPVTSTTDSNAADSAETAGKHSR